MPHQAYIEIPQRALAEVLLGGHEFKSALPKGAKLVTIRINPVNDNLVLVCEHEKFSMSEGIQRVPWMTLPKVT